MVTASSKSISSGETDTSTLNEVWHETAMATNTARIRDVQVASESLRSMIQALGLEKMEKIRSLIAEHHHGNGTPLPPLRRAGSDSALPVDSSSNPDGTSEEPTDEVALTICYLESALGAEDMAELRTSMISVRRASIHVDVMISSDMTEEQLQLSVEAVKVRQEEVLESLFVEIMGLVAEKLGIDLVLPTPPFKTTEQVVAQVVKKDESNMLKVPEIDPTGRTKHTKKKEEPVKKKAFDGYSLFYGKKGDKIIRVGEGKGKGKTSKSGGDEKTKEKKKKRGCMGFCTMM